jgi:hypothetical protein
MRAEKAAQKFGRDLRATAPAVASRPRNLIQVLSAVKGPESCVLSQPDKSTCAMPVALHRHASE